MELISVIIPAYNVEGYLKRCIDSVCAQSYKNIEVLVIDDGSCDSTPAICDECAAEDDRIRVVHKGNEGVAAARNTALDMAGGEMIAFADADDYCEPDMLKNLYEVMLRYGADMACCGYYEEYTDKTVEHGTGLADVVYTRHEAYEDYLKMGGRMGSGCWNKLIRAGVLKDIRYKPYVMGEDVEMLCRTIDRCELVACTGYPGYHYIHRGDSATRAVFGPNNVTMLYIANEMLDFIRQNHPELTERMYAFHAEWHSAQIQAMYWTKGTGRFVSEKEQIRENIRKNMEGYVNNPYVPKRDIVIIRAFMHGIYRPVQTVYDVMSGFKRLIKR